MVWRESDDAIGDLLRCDSPRLAGDLDYPEKIDSWWADRTVPIDSALLGRQDLFHMASEARESGDLVPLLWHVLAWGVMARLEVGSSLSSTRPQGLDRAPDGPGSDGLPAAGHQGCVLLEITCIRRWAWRHESLSRSFRRCTWTCCPCHRDRRLGLSPLDRGHRPNNRAKRGYGAAQFPSTFGPSHSLLADRGTSRPQQALGNGCPTAVRTRSTALSQPKNGRGSPRRGRHDG